MISMHIGIDDTDSPLKGCTTYIAAILIEKLQLFNVSFLDYPNLIRLNPNIPWKTRGNGALCIRIECEKHLINDIIDMVVETVEDNSDMSHVGTDPGIVFFFGKQIPEALRAFAKHAIQGIVKMNDAVELVKEFKAEAIGFKKRRGIIGALAAIGEILEGDYTYELIAYRTLPNRGKPRQVDASSVIKMNGKTAPLTFNNIDLENSRLLITPHGPDPILYGIRGENADIVKKAHTIVRALEPIERWMIFRTNQGTDAHLQNIESISHMKPYHPIIIKGTVTKPPQIIPKRHVIFTIRDETGQTDCAAYEPTGDLRKAANQLIVGDIVEVYGGVRPESSKNPLTINLEKFRVVSLARKIEFQNPLCPNCGKRMKSMGKRKGFKCDKCSFRSSTVIKTEAHLNRDLKEKLYITSTHSQRHLTKPFNRYGQEKTGKLKKMIRIWNGFDEKYSVEKIT
jgi:tRNA(Ile2)-agmatinylcytidine synthase